MQEDLREALREMAAAHEELARIQIRLRDVSAGLPAVGYDEESGEPTNLAAAWQLGLDAHVTEPLQGAVALVVASDRVDRVGLRRPDRLMP